MAKLFTTALSDKVKDLQDESRKQVNHSIGYHGSKKDECIHCGEDSSHVSRHEHCAKGTKERKERLKPQIEGGKVLLKRLKGLSKKDRKVVSEFLSYNLK